MAKKKTERVKEMIRRFMDFPEDDRISKVAKEFGITRQTIYVNLQEIADLNGVTRESLLEQPKSKYKEHIVHKSKDVIDFSIIDNSIAEALKLANFLKEEIAQLK